MPRARGREGDSFDRYVIDRRIGEGASAEVYAARDPKLGRRVALKVLRDGVDAERVLREVRAAAHVVHPNVVTVYDVGEAGGVPFLVMELLSGQSLRVHISERRESIEVRMHWAMQLASALAAIHAAGLVHRDVKPENVFVTEDGVVKLLDFGIARVTAMVDRAATTRTLGPLVEAASPPTNEAGLVRGTPAYMAPEQMRGEVIDARVDQFAWGVLAFEALSGERPWSGEGDVALVAAMLGAPPASLCDVDPSLPRRWDAAIRRCLLPRARDRFASMDAVLDALHAPVRERDAMARVGRWLVAAALAIIAGAAFFPRDAAHARVEMLRAEARRMPREDAKAAYDEGIFLLRKASFRDGVAALHRAASLDASFAEAHLRAAIFAGNPDATARRDLQLARELRAGLSARDRALLDAFEPWASEPPNWAETERRLGVLSAREPGDAELHLLIGWNRYHAEDHAGAVQAYEDALAIEPENALAWNLDALSRLMMNDVTGAAKTSARCLEVSPAATSCLRMASLFARAEGRCEDAETIGRRFVALAPSFDAYEGLADAIYGARADLAGMREALLDAARARADSHLGASDVLTRWSVLAGDFTGASRHALAWEAAISSSGDEWTHYVPRAQRIRLAYEMDDLASLKRLAQEHLDQSRAWMGDHSDRPTSIYVWSVLYRAGIIDAGTLAQHRAEWLSTLRSWKAAGAAKLGLFWIGAFAEPAKTEADAREALRARDAFDPVPVDENIDVDDRLALGRVARLSGHIDEAVDVLTRLTRACLAIRYPFHVLWAHLELGEALEGKGDIAGACNAYEEAVMRWQTALRSRSVSAARARIHALRCERLRAGAEARP